MALVEKDSNLKPTYRSMPPNIFLSISYSLLNLFDGAILLQDERLLVNQLEQLIQQFSRLAGLAKTKSAKLMLTEQGIFSAKQSANIQQITPLINSTQMLELLLILAFLASEGFQNALQSSKYLFRSQNHTHCTLYSRTLGKISSISGVRFYWTTLKQRA